MLCRGAHVDDGTLSHLLGDWEEKTGQGNLSSDGSDGSAHDKDNKRLFVAGKEVTEDQLKGMLHVRLLAQACLRPCMWPCMLAAQLPGEG